MIKKTVVVYLIVNIYLLPLLAEKLDGNQFSTKLTLKEVGFKRDGTLQKAAAESSRKNYDRFITDAAGRITKILSKDKGEITFFYDEYGNLKSKIKAGIEQEVYFYDKLGRNTRIEYSSNGRKDRVEFKYSTPVESYKPGNLIEKIEKNERSIYEYSGAKLVGEKKIIGGNTFKTKYRYDTRGRLSEIHYPGGMVVGYSYDDKNKIHRVSVLKKNGEKVTALDYTRSEDSLRIDYGNGLTTFITPDNEKKSIAMKTEDIQDLEFRFNDKGLIEKVIDKKERINKKEFHYDGGNRLITAYGPWGKTSYRYDAMDNIVSLKRRKENLGFTYGAKSAKIETLTKNGKKVTVAYDRLGRMTMYDAMTFDYNARGRLAKITRGDGTAVELFYNHKNQRVMERNQGVEYYYIYDKDDRVLAKYDAGGTPLVRYIYSKELPVAFIKNNRVYYYHYDLMSFPVMISDESGKRAAKTQATPYGEPVSTGGAMESNLRFPGQFEIKGTNLCYNLNRTYLPELGRYLEPDPLTVQENLYQYTSGNPVMYVDYKGLYKYKGLVIIASLSVKLWLFVAFKLVVAHGTAVQSDCFRNKDTGYLNRIYGSFDAIMGGIGVDASVLMKSFGGSISATPMSFQGPFAQPDIKNEFSGFASFFLYTIAYGYGAVMGNLKLGHVKSITIDWGPQASTPTFETFLVGGVSWGKNLGCFCCD
ncbi:MAG: RHS repeat-associated core domain-containing protein [bacterium]|nr:RHS repeat-associated core domain-containing protein [bacterium]